MPVLVQVGRDDQRCVHERRLAAGSDATDRERTRRSRAVNATGGLLYDVVTFALATGCRIGEILGLTWRQLDLDTDDPTVTIDGTLVEPRKGYIDYLHRQPTTKTGDIRQLYLPATAAETPRRRLNQTPYDADDDPVFATRNGTWLAPANLRDDLRTALHDTRFAGTTPHTFRRTVGTLIAYQHGPHEAERQLGHRLGTGTIVRYIAPETLRPDRRELLATLLDEPTEV